YKISGSIQQFACHDFLGANFTASCDDFLTLYLPTVLYMTFEQFTPEGVCTKMKSCDAVSMTRVSQLSKQQRLELNISLATELSLQTALDRPETAGFQHFIISELKRSACDHLSGFATTCDKFVDGVIPKLFAKFFEINKSEAVCSKIHFAC
ncbi:surfactant protein B, partial [Oesophagostomum dentatum]